MIPLRDSKDANMVPLITYLIIGINILVFILELMASSTDAFIAQYALIPSKLNFSDWTTLTPFLTHMFLHGGFLHIISNMWFLNIFGDNVEERFGSITYLFVYLFSGLVGAVLQLLFMPGTDIPMLGASGAVAGVLGAYLVFFPGHRIRTLIPLGFFVTTSDLPASIMLIYWFATQFFSGVGSVASVDMGGVAFWAHVGGFAAGYIIARLFASFSPVTAEEGELLD